MVTCVHSWSHAHKCACIATLVCTLVSMCLVSMCQLAHYLQAVTHDVSAQAQEWHHPSFGGGPTTQRRHPLLTVANVSELLGTHDMLSAYTLQELVASVQTQDCATSRYLFIDDITPESGLGWSMLSIVPLALHALVTGRILVHASSVIPHVRWAWCLQPPHSPDCYFRPWTTCIPYLKSKRLSIRDFQGMPHWTWSNYTAADKYVAHRSMHKNPHEVGREYDRSAPFEWVEPMFQASTLKSSRFWWYGLVMRSFFTPSSLIDHKSVDFLSSNGVKIGQNFIVAHLRHGSKGTEQRLLSPAEYIAPLKYLCECLQTRHIFLVTETRQAADTMKVIASNHSWNMFTVDYSYPNRDVWNPKLVNETERALMAEVTKASAMVLAVTRRGSAFVGTLHSAWAKISVSHMYGFRGRPVPAISLAPGYKTENSYIGRDSSFWTFNLTRSRPWPCLVPTSPAK